MPLWLGHSGQLIHPITPVKVSPGSGLLLLGQMASGRPLKRAAIQPLAIREAEPCGCSWP